MTVFAYRIELLTAGHDRTAFHCGVDALDQYFQTQVTQDIKRKVTTCHVLVAHETKQIAGFYTLASSSVPLGDLPQTTVRKLPRYPSVPTVRIGRLAVDRAFQGKKLGSVLIADAITRVARSNIGTFALMVDAKDDKAAAFYQHHGFIAFESQPRVLFLPMATALQLIDPSGTA